jgi:hypothetical protein
MMWIGLEMPSFTAQIRQWNDRTERKMTAVLKQSAQDVIADAQTPAAQGGNMAVDTGFLRNSLVTEVNGAQVAQGSDSYTLAISQLEPGDYLRAAWTAEYARMRHYNPVNGGPFRDAAAARWQQIVDANVRRVRDR